jgi:hypothetical protein
MLGGRGHLLFSGYFQTLHGTSILFCEATFRLSFRNIDENSLTYTVQKDVPASLLRAKILYSVQM